MLLSLSHHIASFFSRSFHPPFFPSEVQRFVFASMLFAVVLETVREKRSHQSVCVSEVMQASGAPVLREVEPFVVSLGVGLMRLDHVHAADV